MCVCSSVYESACRKELDLYWVFHNPSVGWKLHWVGSRYVFFFSESFSEIIHRLCLVTGQADVTNQKYLPLILKMSHQVFRVFYNLCSQWTCSTHFLMIQISTSLSFLQQHSKKRLLHYSAGLSFHLSFHPSEPTMCLLMLETKLRLVAITVLSTVRLWKEQNLRLLREKYVSNKSNFQSQGKKCSSFELPNTWAVFHRYFGSLQLCNFLYFFTNLFQRPRAAISTLHVVNI